MTSTLTHSSVSTPSTAKVARLVAVCAAAVAAGSVVVVHPGWYGFAAASSLAVAVFAAAVDVREQRLPDRLVALTAVPSVTVGLAGGDAAAVLFGAAVLALPVLVVHVVAPVAMGFGDVKLAAALGATVGLFEPTWSLVALCIASGLTAVAGLTRRREAMPFGPGLVAGAFVAVVATDALSGGLAGGLAEGRLPWR